MNWDSQRAWRIRIAMTGFARTLGTAYVGAGGLILGGLVFLVLFTPAAEILPENVRESVRETVSEIFQPTGPLLGQLAQAAVGGATPTATPADPSIATAVTPPLSSPPDGAEPTTAPVFAQSEGVETLVAPSAIVQTGAPPLPSPSMQSNPPQTTPDPPPPELIPPAAESDTQPPTPGSELEMAAQLAQPSDSVAPGDTGEAAARAPSQPENQAPSRSVRALGGLSAVPPADGSTPDSGEQEEPAQPAEPDKAPAASEKALAALKKERAALEKERAALTKLEAKQTKMEDSDSPRSGKQAERPSDAQSVDSVAEEKFLWRGWAGEKHQALTTAKRETHLEVDAQPKLEGEPQETVSPRLDGAVAEPPATPPPAAQGTPDRPGLAGGPTEPIDSCPGAAAAGASCALPEQGIRTAVPSREDSHDKLPAQTSAISVPEKDASRGSTKAENHNQKQGDPEPEPRTQEPDPKSRAEDKKAAVSGKSANQPTARDREAVMSAKERARASVKK